MRAGTRRLATDNRRYAALSADNEPGRSIPGLVAGDLAQQHAVLLPARLQRRRDAVLSRQVPLRRLRQPAGGPEAHAGEDRAAGAGPAPEEVQVQRAPGACVGGCKHSTCLLDIDAPLSCLCPAAGEAQEAGPPGGVPAAAAAEQHRGRRLGARTLGDASRVRDDSSPKRPHPLP